MTLSKPIASTPRKPARKPLPSVDSLTEGQLADEHRSLKMGLWRYQQRLEQIEAELQKRNVISAEGARAIVSLQITDIGLIDVKRLRADLGDDALRPYAIPGSDLFYRSADKPKQEG